MPHGAARPIMGERRLGERPIQESWDLALGTHQRALIELGYEGVSIEQVLEQRLRRAAYDPQATTAAVPAGRRGRDAVPAQPPPRRRTGHPRPRGAGGRAQRRRRARGAAPGAPAAGVLPDQRAGAAGVDRVVRQDRLRALLHAAADGVHRRGRQRPARSPRCWASCSAWRAWRCRSAATGPSWSWRSRSRTREEPAKVALLWAAQVQLGPAPRAELRARCDELLANPLVVPAYPRYLSGFVHALEPVPAAAPTSSWRRCRTRSAGCRTRCCCRGCRR